MLSILLIGALALGLQQQTDTTFAVAPGGTLRVDELDGTVVVRSWDRDAMRVRASHPSGTRINVQSRGSEVRVQRDRVRNASGTVSYEVLVPRGYAVRVEGIRVRTTIEDVHGAVRVSNAEGEITLRNITGNVNVESVNGAVVVSSVRGRVDVSTVNQSINLSDVHGDVSASAINGGVVMRAMDARRVEASTINGAVEYAGSVHDGGRYYLGTHNGRVTMGIPEQSNAAVTVATRTGRMDATFAVPVGTASGGRLTFTLGSGSAAVELESFNGAVRLVRPGAMR